MLVLTIVGLVPTLVLFGFVTFEQDQLVVSGTALGSDLHAGTLGLAMISLFSPLILLAPPGFAFLGPRTNWIFWLCVWCSPIGLTAPGILAACLQGGAFHHSILVIWICLGVLMVNLTLWFFIGLRFLSPTFCLIFWGVFWALQGFLSTLTDYLLPNLDLGFWAWLAQIKWVLPPLSTGIQAVDRLVHQDQLSATAPMSWIVQIIVLTLIMKFFLKRRVISESQDSRPD